MTRHLPDGDIGYWTAFDGCTGIWIDLPDKQGLLYLTGKGYGGHVVRLWRARLRAV